MTLDGRTPGQPEKPGSPFFSRIRSGKRERGVTVSRAGNPEKATSHKSRDYKLSWERMRGINATGLGIFSNL